MKVADAKRVARRWVREVASGLPGFQGAFFHGSINGMSDAAPFPPTSDVDVGVVFAHSAPPAKLGKNPARRGSRRGSSHPARSARERRWILARCEDARSNCLKYVSSLDTSTPYYVQAACWLFAEGNLTHVLLAAGMRNPTVRRRYAAARALLASAGRLDVHEALLSMLGCAAMSRTRVERHLDRMADAFDRAASMIRSEFPFGSDISEAARPVAVDGSRELIRRGEHREAVFWIAATYSRCMAVLETDGPRPLARAHEPGFRSLLRELGVEGFEDMRRRAREIQAFLPELMALASDLVAV